MASFIKTPDQLVVVFSDGSNLTVYPSNPNFDSIVAALNEQDWDSVKELADPAAEVKRVIADAGVTARVRIEHGVVLFDDKEMHSHLTDRMLDMLTEGFDISPLALFLENLMGNPSFRAVNELYTFLEASELPITDDGCFLAYKRVGADYMDVYSSTYDNSIGAVCEMARNEVDEDKSRTCSNGLHFCSREYLPHYGAAEGGHVMIVKINPADVVAIPDDYNNAKGRTCRYEVIGEMPLEEAQRYSVPEQNLEGLYFDTSDLVEALEATDPTTRILVQRDDVGDVVGTFTSPSEAGKATGIDSSSISKVARGLRQHAGGYRWGYYSLGELAELVGDQD